MNRVFSIYLVSLLLIYIAQNRSPITFFGKSSDHESFSYLHNKKEHFEKDLLNDLHSSLLFGYLFGQKKKIPKKIKDIHKTLVIMHLFTPSGLHFSSILLFFSPLLSFLKKRNLYIFLFFYFTLCLLPFFENGLFSIKRICFFQILKTIKNLLPFKLLDFVQNFHLFLLTFLIDFFLGSFEQSPLSFSYSFLFLGLIFAQDEFNKKKLLLYFLGAQIILSFFNGEGFYLIGIINGFLITSLFSLLFPLWLIIFFLPSKMTLTSFLYDLFNFSMEIFLKTILSLNEFTKIFERHFTSIPLIFLVLAISSSISFQLKKNILIFVLFIHSNPLYNFPLQFFKKEYEFVHFKSLKGKKIDRFKTQKNGFKIFFKNGKVCSYAQKRAGYKERCSFK